MDSRIEFRSQLIQSEYQKTLFVLSLLRLRFLLPILAFFSFSALASGRYQESFFLFGALIGTFVIIWLWVTWQAYSPSNAVARQPVYYSFGADRIEFEGADQRGIIEWESIKRWRYLYNHYLLHASSASFLVIPARCVAEEDRGPLEEMFKEHIKKGPRGPVR